MKQLRAMVKGKPKICTCGWEFGVHTEGCLTNTHGKTDYYKWCKRKVGETND